MDEKKRFSLGKEIQKRKTQEMVRGIEKRIATGRLPKIEKSNLPSAQPASNSQRTTQVSGMVAPDTRRTAQTMPAVTRTTQTYAVAKTQLTFVQKRILIAAAASILIGIVMFGTLLFASSSTGPVGAKALPLASADDVLGYLKTAGVEIADLQAINGLNSPWHANQAYQFAADIGDQSGTFIVLSYAAVEQKVPDIFRASVSNKFKSWELTTASNIVVLAAPNTGAALTSAMRSHLTQYLVAPYRNFLPTATAVDKVP